MNDYRDIIRAKGIQPLPPVQRTAKPVGDIVLHSWARPVEVVRVGRSG